MMNESDLKYKVQLKLTEYDNIGLIQPTNEWYNLLSTKIENNMKEKSGSISFGIYTALIFLVIINLGIVLNSVMKNSDSRGYATSDLQVISSQLLVVSNSGNN
jgi:hypothetical protein